MYFLKPAFCLFRILLGASAAAPPCENDSACGWAVSSANASSEGAVAATDRRAALIQREVAHSVRPAGDDHGPSEATAPGNGGADAAPAASESTNSPAHAEAEAVLHAGLNPGGGESSVAVDASDFRPSISDNNIDSGAVAAEVPSATDEAEAVLDRAMDGPPSRWTASSASTKDTVGELPVEGGAQHEAEVKPDPHEAHVGMPEEDLKLRCMFASHETPMCVGMLTPYVDHPHFQARHTVMVVVLCIVVLAMLFCHTIYDKMIDLLQEHVGHYSVKLAYAMFKEIMMLGIIALSLSVLIRSGFLATWSKQIFEGDHPPEGGQGPWDDIRGGHWVSELTIIFEDIHMIIFFSCLSLACITVMNLLSMQGTLRLFRHAEEALTINRGSVGITMADLLVRHDAIDGNYFMQLRYWEQICYLTYREGFTSPPTGSPARGVRSENFSFLGYIESCCGQAVVDQVQTPLWCYLLTMAGINFVHPLLTLRGWPAVCAFVAISAMLAAGSALIAVRLAWIQRMLVPSTRDIRTKCCPRQRSEYDEPTGFMLERIDMKLVEDIKPYKKLRVAKYHQQSTYKTWLMGTERPSRREQLFWLQRNGPTCVTMTLRLISAGVSASIGATSYHIWSFPFTWCTHFWALFLIIFLYGVTFYASQASLMMIVMIASTEMQPRLDVIDLVNATNRRLAQEKNLALAMALKRMAVKRSLRQDADSGFTRWLRVFDESLSEQEYANATEVCSEALPVHQCKAAIKSLGEAFRAQSPHLGTYLDAVMEAETDATGEEPTHLEANALRAVVAAANIAENGAFSRHLQDQAIEYLRLVLGANKQNANSSEELPKAPLQNVGARGQAGAKLDVFMLEALMERLEYSSSHSKSGLPRHAQAMALLRATSERFGQGTWGLSKKSKRKWEATPEELVRYLATLHTEVCRPDIGGEEGEDTILFSPQHSPQHQSSADSSARLPQFLQSPHESSGQPQQDYT